MKKLLAGAAIIASLTATNSQAAQREQFPYWYLGLSAGLAAQTDSDVDGSANDINWDTGVVASTQIGYQPAGFGGFRPELEYSYRRQDISNGDDITVNVIAANLFYDFYNSSQFTPYIGGGLGYGHFNLDGAPGNKGSDSSPVYQGMVGIGYEPTTLHNVGFSLGYRYLGTFSDPEVNGGNSYEYDNHSVELGAKFRF